MVSNRQSVFRIKMSGIQHGQMHEVLFMLSEIHYYDVSVSHWLCTCFSHWLFVSFLGMIWGLSFNSGYFHADPHPGNILATRAGELVYLDFGMMSEAPLSARLLATLSFLYSAFQSSSCTGLVKQGGVKALGLEV